MGLLLEPGTTLAVEEISDLKAIEANWQRLWRQLPDPTTFQSFPFIEAAAANIPPEYIRILAAQADEIVGLVPLYGDGTLRLLGGSSAYGHDALVLPGFEQMLMDAIADHLRQQSGRWHTCEWEHLRSDSALLLSEFGPEYVDLVEAQEICPILTLAGNDRSGAFKPFEPQKPAAAPNDPNTYRRVIRRI